MTNGEKIRSMFPNMNFGTLAQDDVIVNKDYSNNNEPQVYIPMKWWNAEYKEPTTKNDLGVDNQNIRLINADALIKRLRPKHFDWWGEGEQDDFSKGNNSMLEEVIEAIEESTPVTQIKPKGYWIEHQHEAGANWEYSRYECSECHDWAEDDSDYCPYCGIQMNGIKSVKRF